jgi:RNA polymerase-binding transcription factor
VDPERAQELLARERERIERALADLRRGGNTDPEPDPGDQASGLYADELDQSLAEQLRRDLDALERAEARLAEGTYGLSVESGEPIPDERLEIVPTAERTAEEQERYERRLG